MKAVEPLVKDCYRDYKQKGLAIVHIEVGKGGKVKGATISGRLAKTRTAVCVKAVLKTARFRQGGFTFDYPVVVQ